MDVVKSLPSMELEHTDNGCYQRCFLIRQLLEGKGVSHGHAHIKFNSAHHWSHHAAAWTVLDTGQTVIIDPSEFDKPIRLESWKEYWENGDAGIQRFSITENFLKKPSPLAVLEKLWTHAEAMRLHDNEANTLHFGT